MIERNTVVVDVGERKIGFRNGMLSIAACYRELGVKSDAEFRERLVQGNIEAVIAMCYGAAYEYAKRNKQSTEFTLSEVGDWLEQMGNEQAEKVTAILLEAYIPKNVAPPEKAGESEQASKIGNTSPELSLV